MRIPLTDVSWQHRQVWPDLERAVRDYLLDSQCDGAETIVALERMFEERFPGHHAVAVHSGLAAEFLILKALGLGPGDEVIAPPNSDLATTAAVSHTGATFVLADVDRRTHNLDPEHLEQSITPRTRAIVPVHMYGNPADMDPILGIARQRGLLVIEDATLALGARYCGYPIGTLGDAAFFSFSPRKVLGSAGHGGMVLTRRSDVAEGVRLLRAYGQDPRLQDLPMEERVRLGGVPHTREGYNLRLDGLQAAIIAAKLPRHDEWISLRRAAAARYADLLEGCPGLWIPWSYPGTGPVWRNYTVAVENRDAVRSHLQERGIATGVLYTPPVHLQPVYRDRGYQPGAFPNAEWLAERLMCLPIFPGISGEQVDEVARAVRELLSSTRTG